MNSQECLDPAVLLDFWVIGLWEASPPLHSLTLPVGVWVCVGVKVHFITPLNSFLINLLLHDDGLRVVGLREWFNESLSEWFIVINFFIRAFISIWKAEIKRLFGLMACHAMGYRGRRNWFPQFAHGCIWTARTWISGNKMAALRTSKSGGQHPRASHWVSELVVWAQRTRSVSRVYISQRGHFCPRASCRKENWKRTSVESSLVSPRRPNRSRDWTELNSY